MLSIIVCHRNKNQLNQFKKSLEETIGTDYELIVVDNSQNTYGICEAYNLGASSAKFPFLCFIHEDVLFHTQDWGEILLAHFSKPEVGAVGVAGARFFGTKWAAYKNTDEKGSMRLIQHFKNGEVRLVDSSFGTGNHTQVKSLDGVFIACRKYIWEAIKFDQVSFPNFHCYDMDFTLRVSELYDVLMIKDLLIEHFSSGNYDRRFFEEKARFNQKWQHKLPMYVSDFSPKKVLFTEWKLFWNYAITKRKVLGFSSVPITEILGFYKKYPNVFYLLTILAPWPFMLFSEMKQIMINLAKKP